MKSHGVRTALVFLGLVFATTLLLAQAKKSAEQARRPVPTYRDVISWSGFSAELLLQQIDADHDGVITRDEWDRFFRDHDENKDERLVPDELQSAMAKEETREELNPESGREKAFQRLDANKDSLIERSEWPGNDRSFKRMDANHDGVLSHEEFLSRNGRYWNEIFEDLDFNGDGLITRDEWLDSDVAFQRLDHDHNGVIERFEFYTPE